MKINNTYLILCCVLIIYIIVLTVCMANKKTLYELTHKNNFGVYFNENKFLPKKNIKRYWYLVKKGYVIMKNTDIVIGGLFVNSSKIFNKFKLRIENLMKLFRSVKCVFFENDSTDNSRILLLDWEKNNPNIHIIRCEENNFCLLKATPAVTEGHISEKRMKKMVKYRNILLNYIKYNFQTIPYVAIIDTDLKGPISFDGIAHSFGIEPELNWDMISAYGINGLILTLNNFIYYDGLALKTSDYNTSFMNNFSFTKSINFIKLYIKYIYGLKRGDEPIQVKSAFCGFSLYKMDSRLAEKLNYNTF